MATLGLSREEFDYIPKRQAKNSIVYEQYSAGVITGVKAVVRNYERQEHCEQMIVLDPSYALAYSGLAETYALLGSYDVMPLSESHRLRRQAALTALELDDSLAEAHRSRAAIIGDHYWQRKRFIATSSAIRVSNTSGDSTWYRGLILVTVDPQIDKSLGQITTT
jgi:hypothetical protein